MVVSYMRRLLVILSFILMFIFLFSCDDITSNDEYKVNLITPHGKVTLCKYTKGSEYILDAPVLTQEESSLYTFVGWYDNEECLGEDIKYISSTSSGDLTFYAKFITNSINSNNISLLLSSMTNYKYRVRTYFEGEFRGFEETVEYVDKDIFYKFSCDDITYNEYIDYHAGISYLVVEENGEYKTAPVTEEISKYYLIDASIVDISNLNDVTFNQEDNTFSTTDTNAFNKLFFLSNIVGCFFKSLSITVIDSQVSSMIVNIGSEDFCSFRYEFEYYDYNEASFTIPSATLFDDLYSKFTDVINGNDNEIYSVMGSVIGYVGNNFYVSDGKNGLYIYAGKEETSFKIGDVISITGTKDTYKGLVELKDIQQMTFLFASDAINSVLLDSFYNVKDYVSMNVSINSCYIEEVLTSFDSSSNSDASFLVSDGLNTIKVFISKHISTEAKNSWYEVLNNSKKGNKIKISNSVVSVFNDYQITLTESTVLEKVYDTGDEVKLASISVYPNEIKVDNGSSLDYAISLIKVSKNYTDDHHEDANYNEFSYTCDDYNPYIPNNYVVSIFIDNVSEQLLVTVNHEVRDAFIPSLKDVTKIEDIAQNHKYVRGIKSTGTQKLLIIPVCFTDYPAPTDFKENIELAFFGTEEDTGWESVQSFYKKSSYGKLNITGTVLESFQTNEPSTYFENLSTDPVDSEEEIIVRAFEYYDSSVDFSDYDCDKDGFVDSVIIIYSTPRQVSMSNTLWKAFVSFICYKDICYDNTSVCFSMFASYTYMFDKTRAKKELKRNTEVYIHETGHLLGLEDYYDNNLSTGSDGGLGQSDMMDHNVGDHNAFTKMMLGWACPYVVTGVNTSITLNPFTSSGDCIIIPKLWKDSFFAEYYLIDFYTPDGLYEYSLGNEGIFTISGVRIYHVIATLNPQKELDDKNSIFQYNNQTSSNMLITLIQADRGTPSEIALSPSTNSDLFTTGQKLDNPYWYDGTKTNFKISITSIDDKAIINIDFM